MVRSFKEVRSSDYGSDWPLTIDSAKLCCRFRAVWVEFPEIPEMHDRLIAAEAAALDAPVVTRDATLSASPQVEAVW